MRLILWTFFLFCSFSLYSQSPIQGVVTNLQGEPLPFVNILINNSNKNGVSTDINGRFEISQTDAVETLLFSYVGYQTFVVETPFDLPFQVQLTPTSYDIETIEIIAGENPAHRIIKKAVANKKLNDHEKMPAYECLTYNKMNMGFIPRTSALDSVYATRDTSKERVKKAYEQLREAHKNFEQHDIFLVESVSKRKFKYPKDIQEEILHNRVSGFKELPMATLATDAQPFSFYEDQIFILEEAYLNPISKGSTKKYFFQIRDTLYQDQDSIYILSFQPKKGKNFEGLKGLLYIHTNQYAIKNVIAEPFDKGIFIFKIEQQYQWVEKEHWFPEQLNFEFFWKEMAGNYMSFIGTGKTYIKEVNLHPNFPKKTFRKGEEILFEEDAFSTSDSIWESQRLDSLTQREIKTYKVMDSLGAAFKLDKRIRQLTALTELRYSLGSVDWDLRNSLGFNRYEKVRLGLGLTTNKHLSEKIEVGGYYAYGFGDKEWKYGLHANWYLDPYQMNRLEIQYRKDITVPALLDYQLTDNIFTAQLFSEFINNWEYKGATFYSRPLKYLDASLSFGQHQFQPTYAYSFGEEDRSLNQLYMELGVHVRYAYNEKFSRFLGYNIFQNTSFPIIELNYTKGFDNLWQGQYDYSKWLLSFEHSFHTRFLGETHYRIEAGVIDKEIPFSRLFAAPAFGNSLSVQLLSNSFRTMEAFEFLSDRFIHFYFRQDFGSLLFKTKNFHPKIAIEHNLAIGSLSSPNLHQGIDFKTLEKGFFEVGLVLNDLIRFNYFDLFYLGFGVSGFYRYGPYANDSFKDNRRIQVTATTSF